MKHKLLIASFLCLALGSASIHASTLYWSGNGSTLGGAGTWNTTGANWGTSTSGSFTTVWNNANSDSPTLSAGAGATAGGVVTLGTAITINGTLTWQQTPGTYPSYSINGASTMTFNSGSAISCNNSAGGSLAVGLFNCPYAGTVTKTGVAQLEFNNANGTVTQFILSQGTASFAAPSRFGAGADAANFITFNGGSMRPNTTTAWTMGKSITVNSGGGTIACSSTTITVTQNKPITWNNGNLTFTTACGPVILSGTTSSGSGTLTLQTATTCAAANVIPATVLVSSSSSLTLNNNSQSIKSLSGAGTVSLGSGTLTINTAAGETVSGAISGTGGSIVMGGGTTWTLSVANSYTGGTTLNAGKLQVANASALGTGTLTLAGGTLCSSGTTAYTLSVPVNQTGDVTLGDASNTGALTFPTGAWTLKNGTRQLTLASAATISSVIGDGGSGYGLTKAGSGVLTLSGTANTYSGSTTISAGQLSIARDLSLGAAPGSLVANQLILNCGTTSAGLRFTANSQTLNAYRGIYLGVNGGCIAVPSLDTETIAGPISGPGNFQSGGSFNNSLGTNILTAVSTYTGTTIVAAGRLMLGASGALPSGTPLTIAADNGAGTAGAVFDLGGYSQTIGPLTSSTGIGGTGGPDVPTIVLSGALTIIESTSTAFAGQIIGSGGSLTLSSLSTGTLTLAGVNTYTGNTIVSAGTLKLGVNNALPSGAGMGDLSLAGTLDLGGFSSGVGALSGAGTVDNSTGSGTYTLTVGANNDSGVFSGIIQNTSGALALTKSGIGTETLSGANIYGGGTTVSAGTLLVNNAGGSGTGSGTVTVNSGGTLGGTGAISGATTVNSGGTLSTVDAAIATLTFGNGLTLAGTTKLEISAGTLTADQIVMTGGTVTLGGSLTVANIAGTPALGNSFKLINGAIGAGTFSSFNLPALATGLKWDTSQLAPGGVGTITVVCSGTLVAHAGANQDICSGGSVAIGGSPTATGGSGTYTYSWSPATGLDDPTKANPTASPTSTTTYTVTVTDSVGCAASSSMTVYLNAAPAITTPPANQTVCSGSTATFSVTASGSGLNYSWVNDSNAGWGSAWSVNGGGATFLGSSTDNDFGDSPCASFSSQADINSTNTGYAFGMSGGPLGDEVALRDFPALAVGQAVSIDFDNGNEDSLSEVGFSLQTSIGTDVLQFYAVGGQANYKRWDNNNVEQDTGIGSQRTGVRVQFVLTSATTYELIVTPCGGTATTFTGYIDYADPIAQLKLFNQNTTTGADKYVYFNNLLVGGYTDNADNYSGADFAGQDQGNQPIAVGNGNSSYTTPALSVADSGTQYQVVVSGCAGSVLSSAATVTVNPNPTVTVNSPTVCASALPATVTATPSGGTAPYSYAWTVPAGATAPGNVASFGATVAGTYSVVVTDANGCASASGSGTLTINANPTVTVNAQTVCVSALPATVTATPSGGTAPYSYAWTVPAGATDPGDVASFTTSVAGTYSVVVTDSSSTLCTGSGAGTLTINANPTVSVNSQTVCASALPATVTASPAGGTPPYSYAWTVPAGATDPGDVASFGATVAGTYSVVVTDANGCASASGAGTLAINANPTVGVNSQTVCASALPATVTASPAGGTGPYNYAWTVPAGATDPGDVASFTTSVAGTYRVVVIDANRCASATGSGTLTINANPTVSVNSQTICAGASATLTATTSASSPSFLWSPGGQTTASITVSPASTTTYTVTVTDTTTGCANNGSGTVTVNPLPTVSVNSATICAGTSATLNATTSASSPSYLWSPGGQTTASITVSPASTTTYTVTVTDTTTGCANSGSGTVTANPLPTVSVNSQTICAGASATLNATTSASSPSFLWSPGGATTASITVSPASTTTYTVTVTDTSTGCANSGSGTVTVVPQPTLTTDTTNQTASAGAEVTWSVAATGTGLTYQWQRDSTNLLEGVDNFTGVTTASLTNSAVTAQDDVDAAHGYACVISSSPCSDITSTLVSLTVNPQITIACPSNITVSATGPGGATVFYTVTATGGCSPPPFVTANPPSGSTFPIGTTTVNATASDTCSNSANCSFTVTVYPQLTITCPSNITVMASGPSGATVFFTVTAAGGCTPPNIVANPPSGSTFPIGTTTVTATASDTCGNSANCSFTVTVYPQLAITCSSNITVMASGPSGATVFFTVTAAGGCTPPNIVANPPSGSTFPIGTTTVTATASDTCGNSANCSFTVTVYPQLAITCSSNITTVATGPGGATAYFNVNASGGCSPPPFVTANPPSGSTFPIGTTTVLATASDTCGNSTNCSFTVTVYPQVSIQCPSNITVMASGPSGATVFYTVTATGGCTPPNIVANPPSGSTFPIGTTTVLTTASDTCGNSTNCSFQVTVYSPITLSCSTNITVTATSSNGAVVFFTSTASGGCSPPPFLSCNPPSGSTFPIGTTTVTCTASDTCGNSTNCSFQVAVVLPPITLSCSTNITVTATSSNGAVVFFTSSASGGCSPPPFLSCNPPSGSTFPIGTTTVTCTASDTCGSSTNCSFTVTVNPALTAAAGTNQTVCAGGSTTIGGSPTASGGTAPYTYSWTPITGLSDATAANPTAEVGNTTTYTVTVTDHNASTASNSVVLAVPPLPNIESVTLSGGDVTLVWDSLAGQTYRVQYTTDLTAPITWTDLTGPASLPLVPDVTASGATATYTDSSVPATRFYRIFIVCP